MTGASRPLSSLCTFPGLSQYIHVSIKLRTPERDTAGPGVQRGRATSGSALPDGAQEALCLCHRDTLLAYVELAAKQDPQVLL